MVKRSDELEAARRHFINAYLNTGCEIEEASDVLGDIEVDFVNRVPGASRSGIAMHLYYEAFRYEDM